MFDMVDIGRVDLHRELFEKVVRKLRSGQMPPQGRPRPEQPAVRSSARTPAWASPERSMNVCEDWRLPRISREAPAGPGGLCLEED